MLLYSRYGVAMSGHGTTCWDISVQSCSSNPGKDMSCWSRAGTWLSVRGFLCSHCILPCPRRIPSLGVDNRSQTADWNEAIRYTACQPFRGVDFATSALARAFSSQPEPDPWMERNPPVHGLPTCRGWPVVARASTESPRDVMMESPIEVHG